MKVYTNLRRDSYSHHYHVTNKLYIIFGARTEWYADDIILLVPHNKLSFDNVLRQLDIYIPGVGENVSDFDIDPDYLQIHAIPNKFRDIGWYYLDDLSNKYNGRHF